MEELNDFKQGQEFDAFCALVRDRLVMGQKLYGQAGFEKSAPVLRKEIDEELADVVAYCFMMHMRIRGLEGCQDG